MVATASRGDENDDAAGWTAPQKGEPMTYIPKAVSADPAPEAVPTPAPPRVRAPAGGSRS